MMLTARHLSYPGRSDRPPRTTPARVTAVDVRRYGRTLVARATCPDYSAPGRYLYWIIDGEFWQRTSGLAVTLTTADPVAIECLVSRHRDLTPDLYLMDRRPMASRRTLFWIRPDGPVDEYRCDWVTGESGGTWATFATVRDDGSWFYAIRTPRLDDLTFYRFRVTPVTAGNDGTASTWAAQRVVRIPDSPGVDVTLDPDTQYVTWGA